MVLDDIPQLACEDHSAPSPHVDEVSDAIQQTSSGKVCGLDGLPAEIFKHGGRILVEKLTQLYSLIWQHEAVPKNFKDATIIHLHKRKEDRSICDNPRGISFLSTPWKIMTRII